MFTGLHLYSLVAWAPQLTPSVLPKAKARKHLLHEQLLFTKIKDRAAYQTSSSLNFYGPDSIINELSVLGL